MVDETSAGFDVRLSQAAARRFWLGFGRNWLALLVVVVTAVAVASVTYRYFLDSPEHLWSSGSHDRNGHYRLGQSMALHLRNGQALSWLHDVHSAQVWPPFHAILVGLVLGIGGIDYRLAVLPSLAAWTAACVLVFLIARRLVSTGGNIAGLAAVLFFLASPAHRAYATDVMLESLGAALTLAVLYFYIRVRQDGAPAAGRFLALALTALFLTKYNYWMLVVLGLLIPVSTTSWKTIQGQLMRAHASVAWRTWAADQLRNPLTYLLAPLVLLSATVIIAVMFLKQPFVVHIGSHRLEFYRSGVLISITYLVLVLRMAPWWWKVGRHAVLRLPCPQRQIMLWHVYPIAVWFLIPKTLGAFLWFVTFTSHGRASASAGWSGNFTYYLGCLLQDYHPGAASLLIVVMLAGTALLLVRRLRPGSGAVLAFLVIAALLTNYHSANRSRFLHSWMAMTWIAAGAGLSSIIFSRLTEQRVSIRPWLAGFSLAALSLMLGRTIMERGHASEGGPTLDHPSMLELADRFLPELNDARQATIVSNALIQPFFEWTFAERYGGNRQVEINMGWAKNSGDQSGFDAWLRTTGSDKLVYVEMTPGSLFDQPWPRDDPQWMRRRLGGQDRFVPIRQWQFPDYGGVSVSVWRRDDSARASR
jgi:hypothetical protein